MFLGQVKLVHYRGYRLAQAAGGTPPAAATPTQAEACPPSWTPPPPTTAAQQQAFATSVDAAPTPTFVNPQGVNCQKTADGGAICSNSVGYAPGCPKTPPINVPGVAGTFTQGSIIYPKPPPAPGTPGGDPVAATPPPAPAPVAPVPMPDSPSVLLPVLGGIAAGGAVIAGLFLTGVFK